MIIRLLTTDDASSYLLLRLNALRDHPTAFSSSYEEECHTPLETIAERLSAKDDRAIFGAFNDEGLCGMAGIRREDMRKESHKANIWGVYVAPRARATGVGQKIISRALLFAEDDLKVIQVNLSVNSKNLAAIALYERMGFITFGFEKRYLMVNGEPQDEWHMVRFLDNIE